LRVIFSSTLIYTFSTALSIRHQAKRLQGKAGVKNQGSEGYREYKLCPPALLAVCDYCPTLFFFFLKRSHSNIPFNSHYTHPLQAVVSLYKAANLMACHSYVFLSYSSLPESINCPRVHYALFLRPKTGPKNMKASAQRKQKPTQQCSPSPQL
ncbi:hypothetical protein XENOCAPTIV_011887, partial [Xenoophorus captivus]